MRVSLDKTLFPDTLSSVRNCAPIPIGAFFFGVRELAPAFLTAEFTGRAILNPNPRSLDERKAAASRRTPKLTRSLLPSNL